MTHMVDEISCSMRNCSKCDTYKKDLEKYKRKYEQAKSGLSDSERNILIELITNEQIIHIIPKNEYESDAYKFLEQLKAKIRTV